MTWAALMLLVGFPCGLFTLMLVSADYLTMMQRITYPNVSEIFVWGGFIGVLFIQLLKMALVAVETMWRAK